MWAPINNLLSLRRHPLNRGRLCAAMASFARWQLASRLATGPVAVPFVGGTRLLVGHGMTGATGNIYCGLQEFEDMGFVLHALREGDLFVDVGANIGSYTVLAAGACNADVIAFEPVPATFGHLQDNINLNGLAGRVRARGIGLAAYAGALCFTSALDSVNHVIPEERCKELGGVRVPVETLDAALAGESPTVIKIDVEGYEAEVLKGGSATLRSAGLLAVVVELQGAQGHQGFGDAGAHAQLLSAGFAPFRYDPLTRNLARVSERVPSANVLYIRDAGAVRARVTSAPERLLLGRRL